MAKTLRREKHDAWFYTLQDVIMDCRTSITNWERISNPKGKYDLEFAQQGFTKHVCRCYWFVLVTQLAKLFVKGDQHTTSFPQLFKELLINDLDPHYKQRLDDNLPQRAEWYGVHLWGTIGELHSGIKAQGMKMKLKPVKAAIAKVKNCRNQVTAHADIDKPKPEAPTFQDLKKLTDLAEDIYGSIRAGFGFPSEDLNIVGLDPSVVLGGWGNAQRYRKLQYHLMHQGIDLHRFIEELPDPS